MTRARIDGFDQAQRNYDAMEEPCGPEPIEGSCHCCYVQIDGEPNIRAQYPAVVFEWMCPECEEAGLCRSCFRKIEDEEITPPCVARPPARGCVGETKESEHMSTAIDDGGSAFPLGHPGMQERSSGMTLRDYFAAAALQGMMANPLWDDCAHVKCAQDAFDAADAMLAQRKAQAPQ